MDIPTPSLSNSFALRVELGAPIELARGVQGSGGLFPLLEARRWGLTSRGMC